MTEISTGTTATCRHCGHEITYAPWYLDGRGPNPPAWYHTRTVVKTCSTRPVGWDADPWPFATPAVRDSEPTDGIRDAARQTGQQPDETARTLTPLEHDRAWHAIEGAEDPDPGTILAAVLRALRINPPTIEDEQAAGPQRQGAADGLDVVAYRNSDRSGVLLCREHGEGWMGLTPLTTDDLPDGGLCTWRTSGADQCGRDVLIPAAERPDGTCTEDFRRPRCHPRHTDDCPYTDPTVAADPTPLRWGLGDILHGDDDTTIVCLSGLNGEPYWLELEAERAQALRDELLPERKEIAGSTDSLRDRLRRAICEAEGFTWDTDMLEPDEYGDHADAVLAVLNTSVAGLDASQPATDPLTPADRQFLRFALAQAAAVMFSEDDFTDDDWTALDRLRAFAGPSPEDQAAETLAAADTEGTDQ